MSKKNIKIGIVGGVTSEGKTKLYREIQAACKSSEYSYYDIQDKTEKTTSNVIKHISNCDGIVLVVSATKGISPITRELILLIKQLEFNQIIIFISKCDLVKDKETIDNLEKVLKEKLAEFGYRNNQINIIKGTIKKRVGEETSSDVIELINLIESTIQKKNDDEDLVSIQSISDNEKERGERQSYRNKHYNNIAKTPVKYLKKVKTPTRRWKY